MRSSAKHAVAGWTFVVIALAVLCVTVHDLVLVFFGAGDTAYLRFCGGFLVTVNLLAFGGRYLEQSQKLDLQERLTKAVDRMIEPTPQAPPQTPGRDLN